jgi:hypothetical protein
MQLVDKKHNRGNRTPNDASQSAQVIERIGQLHLYTDSSAISDPPELSAGTHKDQVATTQATAVLQDVQQMLAKTIVRLTEHIQRIDQRLEAISAHEATALTDGSTPRTNHFEDISAGPYSQQVVVATSGDIISASRVETGLGTMQWLGQMTDATLQQLSIDKGNTETVQKGARKL